MRVCRAGCLGGLCRAVAFGSRHGGDEHLGWRWAIGELGDQHQLAGRHAFAVSNDVVFYAVGTNLSTTLNGNRVIASLLFNNDADSNVFISGNTLYVNDGITVDQDAAGQHYISSQINLSNSQAWAIDSTNGGTLMVGAVRQNGNRILTKTGGGTLLLTNSALQASNFVIQSGIVRYVGSANGFNDNDTAVQVDAGAVLDKDNIWGTEAFRSLRGAGVVTNWVGELQLRPSNNEYQLFTGAIIQGNSNANLRLVHDGNNSTAALGISSEIRFRAGNMTARLTHRARMSLKDTLPLASGPANAAATSSSSHCTPVRIRAGARISPSASCQPRSG